MKRGAGEADRSAWDVEDLVDDDEFEALGEASRGRLLDFAARLAALDPARTLAAVVDMLRGALMAAADAARSDPAMRNATVATSPGQGEMMRPLRDAGGEHVHALLVHPVTASAPSPLFCGFRRVTMLERTRADGSGGLSAQVVGAHIGRLSIAGIVAGEEWWQR
mgnify:CR=1 FL=1